MIYLNHGDTVECAYRSFTVGMPVRATVGTEFNGMFGTVMCIKTFGDRDKGSGCDPEIYVQFEFPRRPEVIAALIDRCGLDLEAKKEELRDWVRMEPYHLAPSVRFLHMVRHRKSGRDYLVFRDSNGMKVATNIAFIWPYEEFKSLTEPVPIEKIDIDAWVQVMLAEKELHFHDLSYQMQEAILEHQSCDSQAPPKRRNSHGGYIVA